MNFGPENGVDLYEMFVLTNFRWFCRYGTVRALLPLEDK